MTECFRKNTLVGKCGNFFYKFKVVTIILFQGIGVEFAKATYNSTYNFVKAICQLFSKMVQVSEVNSLG